MVESIRGWLRVWHVMGLSRGVGEGKYVEGCWRGQMLLGIEARGQHDSSSRVLHRRVLRVHALVSITRVAAMALGAIVMPLVARVTHMDDVKSLISNLFDLNLRELSRLG